MLQLPVVETLGDKPTVIAEFAYELREHRPPAWARRILIRARRMVLWVAEFAKGKRTPYREL
jgi:hypothetical protein